MIGIELEKSGKKKSKIRAVKASIHKPTAGVKNVSENLFNKMEGALDKLQQNASTFGRKIT